jgi:hypothetical protein
MRRALAASTVSIAGNEVLTFLVDNRLAAVPTAERGGVLGAAASDCAAAAAPSFTSD